MISRLLNHTLGGAPFLANLSGDNPCLFCLGLPPPSDEDSEPLESEDSEEPEPDADSLLDEDVEVWVVDGDLTPLVLFTANLGGIGNCLALKI